MISVDDRWDRPCRVAADGTGKDPRPTRRTLFAVLSSPERRIYERHPGHHSLVRPTFTSTGTRPRRPPMCQNRLPAVLAARSAAPSSGRSQARCPSRPSRKRPTCGNTASFGSAPTRSGGAPAPLIRRVLPPRGTRPASPHPRAWHNPATGTPSPCATRSSLTVPRRTSTSPRCWLPRPGASRSPSAGQRGQHSLSHAIPTALARLARADRFHGARCSVELFLHDVFRPVSPIRGRIAISMASVPNAGHRVIVGWILGTGLRRSSFTPPAAAKRGRAQTFA